MSKFSYDFSNRDAYQYFCEYLGLMLKQHRDLIGIGTREKLAALPTKDVASYQPAAASALRLPYELLLKLYRNKLLTRLIQVKKRWKIQLSIEEALALHILSGFHDLSASDPYYSTILRECLYKLDQYLSNPVPSLELPKIS